EDGIRDFHVTGVQTCALPISLMWLDKADTWEMADQLGSDALVRLIQQDSHTCYQNEREALHDWGYGCGRCPACELRAKGYANWRDRKSVVEGKSVDLGGRRIV